MGEDKVRVIASLVEGNVEKSDVNINNRYYKFEDDGDIARELERKLRAYVEKHSDFPVSAMLKYESSDLVLRHEPISRIGD